MLDFHDFLGLPLSLQTLPAVVKVVFSVFSNAFKKRQLFLYSNILKISEDHCFMASYRVKERNSEGYSLLRVNFRASYKAKD